MAKNTRATKATKLTTFKNRLEFLMGDKKPYAWCKKVGIEKGLFQYYWQMGKTPKYNNLLKIRNFTGCTLDWLMTGEGEPFHDKTVEIINAELETSLTEIDDKIAWLKSRIEQLKALKREARATKAA